MGLSLLNVVSRANFRAYRPKLLSNFVGRQGEFRGTRFMGNYLHKTPIDTTKKVSIFFFFINNFNYLGSKIFIRNVCNFS